MNTDQNYQRPHKISALTLRPTKAAVYCCC